MTITYYILITIITYAGMEGVTWFVHKYVMHGFLWVLHEDHHQLELALRLVVRVPVLPVAADLDEVGAERVVGGCSLEEAVKKAVEHAGFGFEGQTHRDHCGHDHSH